MSGWSLFDSPVATAFGWSVIHFIWQGAIIGLVAFITLECMRTRPASRRCTTAVCALVLCVVSFLVTFLLLLDASQVSAGSVGSAAFTTAEFTGMSPDSKVAPAIAPGWLGTVALLVWLPGFLFMSLRFLGHWRAASHLRRTAVTEPDVIWCTLFDQLKRELGLSSSIRLLQSGLVRTPMVIGWLSPVVLVPTEVFTGLDREQLTLVLRHELNHLRRMDHLINLFQSIAECLLFFHPIVWWLSNQVRIERELGCDRLTIENHHQPRVFAEALFTLERLRLARSGADVQTTLHATGGNLMSRITRLLDPDHAIRSQFHWRTPLAIALSSMVAAGCLITLDAPAGAASVALQQEESAGETFPSAEQITLRLERGVQSGLLSTEQAMKIERLHGRLLMALETGRVDTAQAVQILRERTVTIVDDAGEKAEGEARAVRSKDQAKAKAEYDEAVSRMRRMVKSGEITREQMEQRLNRMKQKMAPAAGLSRADYEAAVQKMTAMVESGEITREQMEQRLNRMKQKMAPAAGLSRADYEAAVQKMTAMVESGEITREQMEQRLNRMKQKMAPAAGLSRGDYKTAFKKMTEMVKSGEITQEQMDQRLARMRQMMGAAPGSARAEYEAAFRKMTEMVKSGEITQEQMDQRLARMKSRVEARKPAITLDQYVEAEAKMTEMVKSGEITQEQMNQRLAEMRGMMAGAAAPPARKIPSPPEGASSREVREWYLRVEERLGMAVESGRMTEGEKDAMLQKIKGQLRSRSAN
ncbi:MAG: M56 family metallopeptidase [Planctomycetota bacterium]|nr:M56 family metallopeptidase [Planctomycetota bacterium]